MKRVMPPLPAPPPSIEELHLLLWGLSSADGRISVRQDQMAKRMGLSKFTLNRRIKEMCEQGRARLVTRAFNHRGGLGSPAVYVITNPEEWSPS